MERSELEMNDDVIPINSMVLGKDGANGDRQTFGMGNPGDPAPTISTAHHHVVAYGISSPTLTETETSGQNQNAICLGFKAGQSKDGGLGDEDEVSPCITKSMGSTEPTVAIEMNAAGITEGAHGVTLNESATTIQGLGGKPGQGYPAVVTKKHKGGITTEMHTPEQAETEQTDNDNGEVQSVRIGESIRLGAETIPECAHTLRASDGKLGDNQPSVILENLLLKMLYIVRRLTPMECERLMGLPDKYTIPSGLEITDELVAEFQKIFDTFGTIMAEYEHKVPPKPKSAKVVRKWLEKISNPDTCPDSPRYKACGNGWATNQPRWILTRLLELDEQNNREQKD